MKPRPQGRLRPRHTSQSKSGPLTEAPPPGPPRPLRPASGGDTRAQGQRAGRGGEGRGRRPRRRGGEPGRAEGAPGRKEAAGGREAGAGPELLGPERRRRHVRQREAQPGLYHRAPAGRLAGAGEVGAGRALVPCPARKWRAGGLAPPRTSLDWAGTGREVPWPQVPPFPIAAPLGGLGLLPLPEQGGGARVSQGSWG